MTKLDALAKLQKRQDYLTEKERLIRASASPLSEKARQLAVLQLEWDDLQRRIATMLRRQSS